MNRVRKLLVPFIFTFALAATLALAATASAELRVGEATGPVDPLLKPEANIIGAKAEYNSDTGGLTFKVTTVAAPWAGTEEEPTDLMMAAGLGTPRVCNATAFGSAAYPIFGIQYSYWEPGHGLWSIQESAGDSPEFPETAGEAAASISVTTTTLVATAPKAANGPYNCAIAYVRESGGPLGEPLIFPIAVPPPAPPADTIPAPSQNQAPAPGPSKPAPAALSITPSKPLRLKVGAWKKVKIKVANPGGAQTAAGSLRLKAPGGVLVKPEKQRLPVLSAGGTWTISAKVRLTAKARKKSTVSLTAAAGGLTAKGALVLKRRG